jgi:hypothetical protein
MDVRKKDGRKLGLIYKNLQHISHAYFSSENAFPYWETVYALIVGQLLIAFFQIDNDKKEISLIMAIVGFGFSICWLILVSLSWQHSTYRYDVMKILQMDLSREYENHGIKFYPESKFEEQQQSLENRISNFSATFRKAFGAFNPIKARNSTWYYRRLLPLFLSYIWFLIILKILIINLLETFIVGTVVFFLFLFVADP